MLNYINIIRNTGQFDSVSPGRSLSLTPFSMIYAENGRGKTTLAAILRSLSTGDHSLVNERQRLGSQNPPHIIIVCDGRPHIFQGGAWSQTNSNIAIFDDQFVAENICSGIELQVSHRQNLHELILGSQGVSLSNNLKDLIAKVEQHNVDLREKGNQIPDAIRGPYTLANFCNLEPDNDIDSKILEAERRYSAARSADSIRQRQLFIEFGLPDFDLEKITAVLNSNLADLQASAAAKVRDHLTNLGEGGETWIAEGMHRIQAASAGEMEPTCPFCAQSLSGSNIIEHYEAYFSESYDKLKNLIGQTIANVEKAHGSDIIAAFERTIRTTSQNRDFWNNFSDLPVIDVDTAAVFRDWTEARDHLLLLLNAKAASPLERASLTPEVLAQVELYRSRIAEIQGLSQTLQSSNEQLNLVKEQADADDLSALSEDLSRQRARKERFEPDTKQSCEAYLAEKASKMETERNRNQARLALDNYRQQVFPTYEEKINDYLRRFNASFRISQVESVNSRSGSSASYCVILNNHVVNISADSGPSFKNTLSAGDRNTLALAFFFTSIDQDPNIANKIVIIDDPMTSLDEHRSLTTRQEMRALQARVQQMIVLSHSKSFLCAVWESADKNIRSAFRIGRIANGSELTDWDVRNDSLTEHDKRHELVANYIQTANPDNERKTAEALRPILEKFIRVAYPIKFQPGSLLGPFIDLCRRSQGTMQEILSSSDTDELRALLDYANLFHHDTNGAYETQHINDTELIDFAERVLQFTSRG